MLSFCILRMLTPTQTLDIEINPSNNKREEQLDCSKLLLDAGADPTIAYNREHFNSRRHMFSYPVRDF